MKHQKNKKAPTIHQNVERDGAQSRKSTRSNYSRKSSRCNNSFIAEKDFDAKSIKSNVSHSRLDARSVYQGDEEQIKEKGIEKLNKMEEKMDYLIKHKLKSLMIKAQSKTRTQTRPFMGAQSAPVNVDGSVIEK